MKKKAKRRKLWLYEQAYTEMREKIKLRYEKLTGYDKARYWMDALFLYNVDARTGEVVE